MEIYGNSSIHAEWFPALARKYIKYILILNVKIYRNNILTFMCVHMYVKWKAYKQFSLKWL